MIDAHAHLEQRDYDKDRDQVIEQCKKELKAVVTCCAHPKDFDLTMQIVEKHKNFIFATVGIHPDYVKEISEKEKDEFLERIKQNRDKIVAIGETGLEFFWIKEKTWQEKQKELFKEFISFAKEIKKPVVVHSRDANEDTLAILEQEDAKEVLLHMWGGQHSLKRILENNWFISLGPILLKSKKHKKIARDFPLEKILLETDSPWFKLEKDRGYPTNIKVVAEKIAEIKKIKFEEVWKACGKNAADFFRLPMSI